MLREFLIRVSTSFWRLLFTEKRLDFSSVSLSLYLVFFIFRCTAGMSTMYTCLVSNLVTFHASDILFPGCHERMAKKLRLQWDEFLFLDVVYHLVPVILFFPNAKEKTPLYPSLVHLVWGAAVSKGTFNLDHVYVSMPCWGPLWLISLSVDASIGTMDW